MKGQSRIIAATVSLICTIATCNLHASPMMQDIDTKTDTSKIQIFEAKLDEYIEALERESIDTKCLETDFLISTPSDKELKTLAAVRLFEHYSTSALMGDETVAVHIYDKWFGSKVLEAKDEDFIWTAKLFATTNRQSLIGKRAVTLSLTNPEGQTVQIPQKEENLFQVLFFYDTGCPSCLAETIMLPTVLKNSPVPISLAAIYIGSDADAWERYRLQKFGESFEGLKVNHLWNPDNSLDLASAYGVLGTPRIFLVSPDGTILGRRLTSPALEKLLSVCKLPQTEYGSEKSAKFYEQLFENKAEFDCLDDGAELIERLSLTMSKDTMMFKQMTGDLLYFAAGQRERFYKEGITKFIHNRILSKPEIWNTEDDSLKVVGFALMLDKLSSLSMPGEKLPKVKVLCNINKRNRGNELLFKEKTIRLDRLKGPALIIFHTEGCNICKEDISAAVDLILEKPELLLVIVNMDRMTEKMPEAASRLMEEVDLSFLPYSTMIGKDKKVTMRYLSATDFTCGKLLDNEDSK